MLPTTTPSEDIENPICKICENAEEPEYIYVPSCRCYLCESCFSNYESEAVPEAKQFAESNCRITEALPTFDPSTAWSISREDYEMGARTSNTFNAYVTRCRHECTNYDKLIAALDRDDPLDAITYSAIRDQIDSLVDDEIENKDLIRYGDEDVGA